MAYGSRLAPQDHNGTVVARNVYLPNSDPGGTWANFYGSLFGDDDTLTLDISRKDSGYTSFEQLTLSDQPRNVLIQGLYGCTSIIVISHRGKLGTIMFSSWISQSQHPMHISRIRSIMTTIANMILLAVFASHFWEANTIRDEAAFQRDVLDVLE